MLVSMRRCRGVSLRRRMFTMVRILEWQRTAIRVTTAAARRLICPWARRLLKTCCIGYIIECSQPAGSAECSLTFGGFHHNDIAVYAGVRYRFITRHFLSFDHADRRMKLTSCRANPTVRSLWAGCSRASCIGELRLVAAVKASASAGPVRRNWLSLQDRVF